MSTESSRTVEIFEAAVLLEPEERLRFVRDACGTDTSLLRRVEAMLAEGDRSLLIDRPIDDAVADLLGDNQPVVIGTQLGPYRVDARLGAGGMGEVYRATDASLGRQVAIKMLPADVAFDPERVARFRREARILAALNHPNIAAIYGVETFAGPTGPSSGLVLELVEGSTLADALAKGPLDVDEALPLARQIADALDAAHQQGIVHRDLKPANIKVRPDGAVKVLDFGLARVTDAPVDPGTARHSLADSPTITTPAQTAAGIILGTAAYMSPEQAKGKPADKRSDIWSFGCVLYEMVTGRRAFAGEDVSETLAAVIKGEPDWAAVPPGVRPLLQRCLQKDPRRRLRDIGDALPLIDEGAVPVSPPASRSSRLAWTAAAIAGVAAIGLVVALVTLVRRPAEMRKVQLAMPLPDGWTLEVTAYSPIAVSPDGRHVALVLAAQRGGTPIVIRNLETGGTQVLAGTTGASSLFWSPDSRFIAFAAGGQLKKTPIDGGPVTKVCDLSTGGIFGGTWSRDGTIVFGQLQQGSAGLKQVSANGGTPRDALPPLHEKELIVSAMPSFLPDGRHLLYTAYPLTTLVSDAPVSLYVQALDSPERVKLMEVGARNVQYANGRLLFVRDRTLLAQPFDPDRLTTSGEPTPVASDIQSHPRLRDAFYSVSQSGVLVFQSGAVDTLSQLTWLDRKGIVQTTVSEPGAFGDISLSADGSTAAAVVGNGLWTIDLGRGVPTRVVAAPGLYNQPVWSDDRSRLAFARAGTATSALYVKPVNGPEEQVLASDDSARVPNDWSRDGAFMLFVAGLGPLSNNDIWILPLAGDRQPYPFATSTYNETRSQFSPDGRWISYTSDETGRNEIHVAPFPAAPGTPRNAAPIGKVRVSPNGGTNARWRADGRELFYLEPASGTIMAAEVDGRGAEFRVGRVQSLFRIDRSTPANLPINVAPDGQRFLIALPVNRADTSRAPTVILNWMAGLQNQ